MARSANPPQFEEKIREKHRLDPKFSFVNPNDSYHAYYQHRIEKIQAGEDDGATPDAKKDAEAVAMDETDPFAGMKSTIPLEPPTHEFVLDKPSLNALDL